MTKKDKKEYLEQLVANQGNQAGISAQLEINEDEINSTVEMAGGHYVLTLSKTPDSSLIIYTANSMKKYLILAAILWRLPPPLGTTKPY